MRNSTIDVVRFHGMKVVSDYDCISVKDKNVIECTSSGNLVCRHYDKTGLEEDNPLVIDILDFVTQKNCTESTITGHIKRVTGTCNLLISEGAIELIKSCLSDDDD